MKDTRSKEDLITEIRMLRDIIAIKTASINAQASVIAALRNMKSILEGRLARHEHKGTEGEPEG